MDTFLEKMNVLWQFNIDYMFIIYVYFLIFVVTNPFFLKKKKSDKYMNKTNYYFIII